MFCQYLCYPYLCVWYKQYLIKIFNTFSQFTIKKKYWKQVRPIPESNYNLKCILVSRLKLYPKCLTFFVRKFLSPKDYGKKYFWDILWTVNLFRLWRVKWQNQNEKISIWMNSIYGKILSVIRQSSLTTTTIKCFH